MGHYHVKEPCKGTERKYRNVLGQRKIGSIEKQTRNNEERKFLRKNNGKSAKYRQKNKDKLN